MLDSEFNAITLLLTANILLLIFQLIQRYRGKRLYKRLCLNADQMKTDIHILCRGATNIDRHISMIEEKIRRLTERQDKLEAADIVKREYESAIRAVKGGASVESLINVHGLSQAEAKLLVSLHGD